MLLLYTMPLFGPKKIVTFSVRTLIRFSESEKRRLELFASFLMTSNESGRLRRFAGPSRSGWIILGKWNSHGVTHSHLWIIGILAAKISPPFS
jgi:hypothetical protein